MLEDFLKYRGIRTKEDVDNFISGDENNKLGLINYLERKIHNNSSIWRGIGRVAAFTAGVPAIMMGSFVGLCGVFGADVSSIVLDTGVEFTKQLVHGFAGVGTVMGVLNEVRLRYGKNKKYREIIEYATIEEKVADTGSYEEADTANQALSMQPVQTPY